MRSSSTDTPSMSRIPRRASMALQTRSPYRDDFFKQIRKTRIFPNYDLYHDFVALLNRTVEDHSVVQLCRGARMNPRRIYFASDFKKKKPQQKENVMEGGKGAQRV